MYKLKKIWHLKLKQKQKQTKTNVFWLIIASVRKYDIIDQVYYAPLRIGVFLLNNKG